MTDTTDTEDSSHGERTHEVTLELTEHAHDQLVEKARRDGEPVDTLASEIVIDQLSHTDRIIHTDEVQGMDVSAYWMLVALSDTLSVSTGKALRRAVRSNLQQLGSDDDTADQRGLLARVRDWMSRGPAVKQEYNIEFLTEQEFTYLTADETADGIELQCRLCGRLFTNEIEECYNHIAGHEEHITQNIDPFDTRVTGVSKAPPSVRTAHVSKRQREQDSVVDALLDDGGGD